MKKNTAHKVWAVFSDKISHIMIERIVKHLKIKNNPTFLFAKSNDFSAIVRPVSHFQKSKGQSQIHCCILSITLLLQGHEAILGISSFCPICFMATM